MQHRMMAVSIWLALSSITLSACSVSVTEREVFQPNKSQVRVNSSSMALDAEDQLLDGTKLTHFRQSVAGGEDGATLAMTYAATPIGGMSNQRLIVHCGGNASERKSDGVAYISKLLPYGNVLLFDYPGYGDSPGEPNAQQLDQATTTVAHYLKELQSEELVLWGQSMGGFVCAALAPLLADHVDAVVFETTAQNALSVAKAWTPWYAGPFVRLNIGASLANYDNVEALANFSGKVLVMGAGQDEALPVSLSDTLAENLIAAGKNTTYQVFDEAEHMNVPAQPEFDAIVAAFFAD